MGEPAGDAPPPRLLVLEDSGFDAELLRETILRFFPGASVRRSHDEATFTAALNEGSWDALLCDQELPEFSGYRAFAIARDIAPDTPFIFVSGVIGEDNAVDLIRQGAADFVAKTRLERLPLAVNRAVRESAERKRRALLETENATLTGELLRRLAALQASEERLLFATKAGRMGVWELDLHTLAFETSSICRENFGRDPALPFTYMDLHQAVHPEDAAGVRAAIERSVRTGEEYFVEYRLIRPDGGIGWIQVQAAVGYGPDGTPIRMAGVSRDITERMKGDTLNRALLRIDDILRQIDEPAELAHRAAQALGEALGANRAGYGRVELADESVVVERDWAAAGASSLAGTLSLRDYGTCIEDLKRGRPVAVQDVRTDTRTRDRSPAFGPLAVRALVNIPVMEEHGIAALLFVTSEQPRVWTQDEIDLVRQVAQRTRIAFERRQAEQELRALANTLESKVEARSRELLNVEAALRQAQKMEAVGQLTGGLAHDFNNLLASISGSLELLKRRLDQKRYDELGRYVDIGRGATQRAAALTHRLLAFSRRQTLDPKPTDVGRLVVGIEDMVRRAIGPAIAVRVEVGEDLWATLVDASQLENALLNLCINARDAMPEGGTLTIRCDNQPVRQATAGEWNMQPGDYVALYVIDSGTGMAPDVLERVFEPFFTTKPLGLGTGLGLSMVYGFAQQSGGSIQIHSEVGVGTTICLYLPRHAAPLCEPAQEQAITPPQAEKGQTVLVVDDESSVRMLVVDVLQDLGYQAREAHDGASALEILRSDARIDLLVTDVGLPGGMNGRQIADAARATRPDLGVLFITGYAIGALEGQELMADGMHLMAKPFGMDALAVRIKELIERRVPPTA